jgi:phenylalanyl-tRNA synthetase beta chain
VAVSRLFEVGRIFVERNGQNLECAAVAFIIAEDQERRWKQRESADFYTAKKLTAELAAAAGIDFTRQPLGPVKGNEMGWQADHSCSAGDLQHGWMAHCGLLNLAMVKSMGIEGKIYGGLFAILPEKVTAESTRLRYTPFGLFPAALRDLALVVEAHTPADEVRKQLAKIARAAVGNVFALENVQIFDVYQGKGLPEGKKSLAFSLVFRAADRTLKDDEVNAVFLKIQDEIAKAGTYQIRK